MVFGFIQGCVWRQAQVLQNNERNQGKSDVMHKSLVDTTPTGRQASELYGIPEERFDARVGGDEVQKGKPAPDIFLRAADAAGAAPENCLVLEDSNAGVQAAHAADMLPIMIPDMVPPDERSQAIAFWVLPSLHTVRVLLRP